jgi:hypothetical protein
LPIPIKDFAGKFQDGQIVINYENHRTVSIHASHPRILDGESLPRFYDLLRRRGRPVFYAFDCLSLDGRDLRARPLLERQRILGDKGADLFRLVCEQDREASSQSGRTPSMAKAGTKSAVRRSAGIIRETASAV